MGIAFAAAASAILAFRSGRGADYAHTCLSSFCDDPSAAIGGVAHGHIGALYNQQPTMGPFSVLLRAPFAALAQLGDDSIVAQYRWGSFACLLLTGVIGLWLANAARDRGAHALACVALAVGVLVNPLTFRALALGHPEEPLAAVLCVAAIVAAFRGRPLAAGVALGLAIATKQWALLAAGPVLLAAPTPLRRSVALWTAAVALVLFAPVVLGNTDRFRDAASAAASPHANATPTNVWWPLAKNEPSPLLAPGTEQRRPPRAVQKLSHWLVLALAFGGAAALFLWRREPGVDAALALAALIFLLRCLLDPYTFSYHHWPFLLSLAAYETIGRRRLPALAVLAGGALWYMSYHLSTNGHPDPLLHFYLAWTLPLAAILAWLTARAATSSAPAR
jgi:hypothetical protein